MDNTPGKISLFDFIKSDYKGSLSRDIITKITIINATLSQLVMYEDDCVWQISVNRAEPREVIVWTLAKSSAVIVVTSEESERWEFRFSESLKEDCRSWRAEHDMILFRSTDTATIAYRGQPTSSGAY